MNDDRDRFERQLADRLSASESRIPAGVTPEPAVADRARRLRPLIVTVTAVGAIGFAVLILDRLPDLAQGNPSSTARPTVYAETQDGDFVLSIASDRATWQFGEPIKVTATLAYLGTDAEAIVWGGGGPMTFDLRQLSGGSRTIAGGQRLPCIEYPIARDAPIVRDRTLPDINEAPLQPGRWEVAADIVFSQPGCAGETTRLSVAATVDVEPAATIFPSPSHGETAQLCRDSAPIDSRGPYFTRDDIEDDLVVIEAAIGDQPEFGGTYISDRKGNRSALEGVVLVTSCDLQRLIPAVDHPGRLRIQLVEYSLADLTGTYESISTAFRDDAPVAQDIAQVTLDVSANRVGVAFVAGTDSATTVSAGMIPAAFANAFGTDGIAVSVVSASELPRFPLPSMPFGSPLPTPGQ